MTRSRFGVATVAAVAVLALGTGAALAAGVGGGRNPVAPALARGGASNAVTAYLGITSAQLRADLKAGRTLAQIADATPGKSAAGLVQALTSAAKAKLDAAVAAGKLTAAQEQFVLAKLAPALTALVQHASLSSPRLRLPGVREALDYLGLTPAQVVADLARGMTLGQIADATPGKSAAGLVQTLNAAARSELDSAVGAGVLTPAREQTLLARLNTLIATVVNGHR